MSEIVNLRQARKASESAKREAEAAANRAKYGQSKVAGKLQKFEAAKTAKTLDGAKRDDRGPVKGR